MLFEQPPRIIAKNTQFRGIMIVNLAFYRPTLLFNKQFVSFTLLGLPEDQDPLLSYCKEKKLYALREKLVTNTPLTWLEYQALYAELSAVIVPDELLPNELHPIIKDIHESTLRHPYKEADIVWQTPDNFMELLNEENNVVEVPRPNHGLSHTVRGAAYIPRIIQYVKTHLNPAYIAAFENYTPRRIRLLQLATLFRVVGRKDETGLLTNVPRAQEIYESYRAASADAFEDYCKVKLRDWKISPAEILRYKQLIYNMGNPAVYQQDITWLMHQNSAITVSEAGFLLDNFFLHFAHTLDAYRYRDDAYEILQALHLAPFCVPTKNEADDFEELLQFPIHLLTAMGDRIIMGKNKVPLFSRDYDPEKVAQNNGDPQFAIAIVNTFSQSECNAPLLLAGPRNRSEATIDLQNLVNDLLNPAVEIKIQLNGLSEIEVLTSHHKNNTKTHYNVTHILWGLPDFEQLTFTDQALKEYEKQVNSNKTHLKAVLENASATPSESDFLKQDPLLRHSHLSYAEKLAINQYTHDENYYYINFILRYGKPSDQWHLSDPILLNIIQDTLLISAIASFGLSKVPAGEILPLGPTQILSRTEVEEDNVDIMQEREENIRKNMPTRQLGFFSTAERAAVYAQSYPFVMWIKQPKSINPQGKKIKELANKEHQKETEVLFPPNTEFLYRYVGDDALLQGTPVRSLNTTSPRPYSRRVLPIRKRLMDLYHRLLSVTCCHEKGYEALQALVIFLKSVLECYDGGTTKAEESELFTKLIYEAQSLADYFAVAKIAHFPDVTPQLRSIAAVASIKISSIICPDAMGPFYYALREGDTAAIQPLVDRGHNINRVNSRGESLIFYAVYKNMLKLVVAMIEAGADVNKINANGQSLLEMASCDEDMFGIILKAESLDVSLIDLLNSWKVDVTHLKLFIQYRPVFLLATFVNLTKSNKDLLKIKNLLAFAILAAITLGAPLANTLFQLWKDFTKSSLYEHWLQMFLPVSPDVENSLRDLINSEFTLLGQTETFLEYLFSDPSITNQQILKLLCPINIKTIIQKIFTVRGLDLTPFERFVLNKIHEKDAEKLFGLLYAVAYQCMREELIRFIIQVVLQPRILKAILITAIANNHHDIVKAVKLSGLKLNALNIPLFNPGNLNSWQSTYILPLFEMYTEEAQATIKNDLARLPILSQEVMTARLQFAEAIKDQALLEKLFTQRKVADVPLVHILLNATPTLLNAYLISYPAEVDTKNAQGETPLNIAISQLLMRRIVVLLSCKANLFLKDAPSPFMQLVNLPEQQKEDRMQALNMLYSEARATPSLTQKFLTFLQAADANLKKSIHEIAHELQDAPVLAVLDCAQHSPPRP